jgi:hypothetical protein
VAAAIALRCVRSDAALEREYATEVVSSKSSVVTARGNDRTFLLPVSTRSALATSQLHRPRGGMGSKAAGADLYEGEDNLGYYPGSLATVVNITARQKRVCLQPTQSNTDQNFLAS